MKYLLPRLLSSACFLISLSFIQPVLAFPRNNPVPGGTVVLKLTPVSEAEPKAYFKNRRLAVLKNSGYWYAAVGIGISTKPGNYHITFGKNKKKKSFEVVSKAYEAQYLTIKNKRKVNPDAEDMKRIIRERKLKQEAKNTWTDQAVKQDFIWPVEGRISSIYGLRRFFNQQARRPHTGLDIAAPEGTPIKAIADARVIQTGDFFFSGNMIFLDHGQGLISYYAHLHKITVKPGQIIKQGEIIGEVGETGRVTGPHLHMSVLLNHASVDPVNWLPEIISTSK